MKNEECLSTMDIEDIKKVSVWKRFFRTIVKGNVPWLLIIPQFIIITLVAKSTVWFPVYQQKITGGDFSAKTISTALGILVLTILILRPLRVVMTQYLNIIVPKNLQLVLWEKINKMPAYFFDKVKGRELISRITEDTANFVFVLHVPLYLYGEILAMWYIIKELSTYDHRLAIFNFSAVPILVVATIIKGKFEFTFGRRLREKVSHLTHYLSDSLRNIPLIKSFVTEEKEKKKGMERINQLFKVQVLIDTVRSTYSMISEMLLVFMKIGAILLGIKLVKEGTITIPMWITFYLFMENSFRTSAKLVEYWTTLKSTQGSLELISTVMYMAPENYDGDSIKEIGDIEFKNVTFAYDSDKKDVLKNVNIRIAKGSKTAIVGPSGSGKTTILSLINRLYEVQEGSIELSGIDIKSLDLNELRSKFSYVTQSFVIYSGSVYDNLVYGVKREVTRSEVEEAAKRANIHELIMKLPQNYDTAISEGGASLSGGERQRIALANAFLCNNEYLLLDEATSNLDADSEARICKAIENISKNKTVIAIAHRLKTIMDADQIIMLNNGEVFDCGTHCELMKRCDVYRELVEFEFYHGKEEM